MVSMEPWRVLQWIKAMPLAPDCSPPFLACTQTKHLRTEHLEEWQMPLIIKHKFQWQRTACLEWLIKHEAHSDQYTASSAVK